MTPLKPPVPLAPCPLPSSSATEPTDDSPEDEGSRESQGEQLQLPFPAQISSREEILEQARAKWGQDFDPVARYWPGKGCWTPDPRHRCPCPACDLTK